MKPFTNFILALCTLACAATISEQAEGGFCYREEEGCGPSTWPGTCSTGQNQSPIDLPIMLLPMGITTLSLHSYHSSSFRLQNNGHSVSVELADNTDRIFAFPDPLKTNRIGHANQGFRQYKLASLHFHWGVSDLNVGSEHCIGGICAAMELHLVHYLANYSSMAEAVASNDPNALAVLGVLIDVDIRSHHKNPALSPIVRHLREIQIADHDSMVTINEPLDLSSLFALHEPSLLYSYKGSLTTPGCNEQVNWFVFRLPTTVPHDDLEAFRTLIKDSNGETLTENHRPLQPRHNRQVLLSTVLPLQ